MPGKKLYKLTIDAASRLQVKLPQQVHPGTKVSLNYGSQQQKIVLSRIFPALDSHALGTAEADLNSMPFNLPSGARIPAISCHEKYDLGYTLWPPSVLPSLFLGCFEYLFSYNLHFCLLRFHSLILTYLLFSI